MIIIGGTIQFETDDRDVLYSRFRQLMEDCEAIEADIAAYSEQAMKREFPLG